MSPDMTLKKNNVLVKEDYQVQSDETLSWLLSSVDYGKFKNDKIKKILKDHENSVTQNSILDFNDKFKLIETIEKV